MDNHFNLIDVFRAVLYHKKFIISFVVTNLFIAFLLLLIVPKQYHAETIVIPANPNLADKNRLSAQSNIQHLYPFFGNDGDQDILIGFLQLPQLYNHLTTKFDLVAYYNLNGNNNLENIYKANELLKDDLQAIKNEHNQVKVSIWMKDPKLAAEVCNEAISYTNDYIKKQWQIQGEKELEVLKNQIKNSSISATKEISISKNNYDSIGQIISNNSNYNNELFAKYLSLQSQIKLGLQTTPNALYIVQPALVAPIAKKPNKLLSIVSVLVASFTFSIIISLLFFKKP